MIGHRSRWSTPEPAKRSVIRDETPFIPIPIVSDPHVNLVEIYSAAVPTWKTHGGLAVVYCLVKSKVLYPNEDPRVKVRWFNIDRGSRGLAEFIDFKRCVATDTLEGIRRNKSGQFSIVLVSRSKTILPFFVARWLMEERRLSLREALDAVRDLNPNLIANSKYKHSFMDLYGASWPPPKRKRMTSLERFPAVQNVLTEHEIDPRLEGLNVKVVGEEISRCVRRMGVLPTLSPTKRLTRKLLQQISKNREGYALLPEPTGKKCLCVFDEGKLMILFADEEIGFKFERQFSLNGTVLEGYLMDDATIVVSDIRVFELAPVTGTYGDRLKMIKQKIAPIDSELFKCRPMYTVSEARWLCSNGFNQWKMKGFSIVKSDDKESFLPVSYQWEFEDSHPLIVTVKVMFSGSRVVGQASRWPMLAPVVDLGPINEVLYGMDGQAAVVRVVGGTTVIESFVLVKAQVIRKAEPSERVWAHKEFMDVFSDGRPLLTQEEMLEMI